MLQKISNLESINDFPKVGLLYVENSGENLLRFYLENIFRIKTGLNIKNEFVDQKANVFTSNNSNLDSNWIICSDFPSRKKEEYNPILVSCTILLVRNPIDLIMSKILKEGLTAEDNNFTKVNEMIEEWKAFYKFWVDSPVPIYLVRYEDLIEDPEEILKGLCKFLLGIKSLDYTKIEYAIKQVLLERIDKQFFAHDIQIDGERMLNSETIDLLQKQFLEKLLKVLRKFNYEVNDDGVASSWMVDFNNDNLVKSIEFHEYINNQFSTSKYLNIKLG